MGSYLKKIREKKQMPQDVVIEYFKDLQINCSKANLSKIERDLISCRADILAALCLIYEHDPREVLFK